MYCVYIKRSRIVHSKDTARRILQSYIEYYLSYEFLLD